MDPIWVYLTNQDTRVDDMNIEWTNRKAMSYQMLDNTLFKQGRSGVLLKCITQAEGIHLLCDIHGETYGSHASHKTLVENAFQQGSY